LHSSKGGTIAQSVEQRTENPCVPGSNPGGTTKVKAFRLFLRAFFLSVDAQNCLQSSERRLTGRRCLTGGGQPGTDIGYPISWWLDQPAE